MGKQWLVLIFIVLCSISFGWAQSTADATNTANATVASSITATAGQTLEFGSMTVGASGGTVTVDPSGTRTSTGADLQPFGIGYRAATFDVSGSANYTYAITLPGSVTITNTGGTGETMTVDSWTSTPSGNGTLDGTGNQTVQVGATLNVGANQAVGTYSGTFTVTFAYN